MKSYKVVYAGGEGEIIEKKSRFIATVRPVECEEEAAAFIGAIKKQYWDATHNCSAFTIGRNHELTRCSDDGEPSGTAGRSRRYAVFWRHAAWNRRACTCLSKEYAGRACAGSRDRKKAGAFAGYWHGL